MYTYTHTGYFANMDWEPANLFYLQCLCEVYAILLNDPKGACTYYMHTIYTVIFTYTRTCIALDHKVHTYVLCIYIYTLVYNHSLVYGNIAKGHNSDNSCPFFRPPLPRD